MKKLLGTALSVALLFPSGPASAELLKNLKLNGGIDVQFTSARNVTDFSTHGTNNPAVSVDDSNNDRIGSAVTRSWVSLMWDLLDDVHAKVLLRKNNRQWGQTAAAAVNTGGQGAGGSEAVGAGGIQADTFVNEAWFKIDKLMGHVDATVGRQFYGEPGDLIAFWGAKNSYGLPVTAIDAFRADASNDWMNFTGLAGRWIQAGAGAGFTRSDAIDVRGIDIAWKMLPVKVNTFIWNRVDQSAVANPLGQAPTQANATGLNDFLWVYGLKVKGEAMGGWVQATAAANNGQNRLGGAAGCVAAGCPAQSRNYIGKALLFDAGYKLDVNDIAAFTPWLNWGWGSGDREDRSAQNTGFQSIASDYRPGVIYGRFASGVGANGLGSGIYGDGPTFAADFDGNVNSAQAGLTNRIIWGFGLKTTPAALNKLTASAAYWDFSFQRATHRVADGFVNRANGNRHLGSEIDFQLDWAHSENVMLSGGWATFQPGGYVKEVIRSQNPNPGTQVGAQEGVSPVTMVYGDISVRF